MNPAGVLLRKGLDILVSDTSDVKVLIDNVLNRVRNVCLSEKPTGVFWLIRPKEIQRVEGKVLPSKKYVTSQ